MSDSHCYIAIHIPAGQRAKDLLTPHRGDNKLYPGKEEKYWGTLMMIKLRISRDVHEEDTQLKCSSYNSAIKYLTL